MANPIIRIHDLASDEVIDREMTNEEYVEFQAIQKANESAIEEKESAKKALLEKLGITSNEAKLLIQ